MTFGSLFAGIGGIDLGLERAGMQCKWQVEIDPYARRVLAKHWPAVPRFEDVRAVGAAELHRVDLIAGGFPCQDISVAGKGAGITGAKSGLWSQFRRIIEELRPSFVFVENSPYLRTRGLGVVLQDLCALGLDAEWHCVPAASVGAPHRRDRICLVAYAHGIFVREQPRRSSGPDRESAPVARDNGSACDVADSSSLGWREERPDSEGRGTRGGAEGDRWRRSVLGGPNGRGPEFRAWPAEPDVGRVAHGIPARVDRLRGLGNAVVPQVAEFIGRRIMEVAR